MGNIVITGATSGIGEAAARHLVDCGYSVLLVARNQDKLIQLKNELGDRVFWFQWDLNDVNNIKTVFDYCKSIGFKINGLVYCAGILGYGPLRNLDYNMILNVMNINCMAFLEMARYAIKREYGTDNMNIVAISSLSSETCYGGTMSYSMSKAALNAACKVLAKEVVRRGIRVNTIMPGYVRTPMTAALPEADIKNEQPLGFIEAAEIAQLIEYLLSDKAKHITGECIPISAGIYH